MCSHPFIMGHAATRHLLDVHEVLNRSIHRLLISPAHRLTYSYALSEGCTVIIRATINASKVPWRICPGSPPLIRRAACDSPPSVKNPGIDASILLTRGKPSHLMWQRPKQPEAGPLLPQSG
jgi:hypothetical protein